MAFVHQAGEVLLLSFPFSDAASAKRRPALVLLDTGDDDILVARITGQLTQTQFDVELQEWQAAGLRIPMSFCTLALQNPPQKPMN